MCPVFFVRIFGMGVERGVSDAVGGFGCGVRRNWSQRQTKFGRKSHFLSTLKPRGADLESAVEHFFKFWRFCSTLKPRGADLESAVEHFFKFWRFCSTLEPARGGFGVGGRTFFQFLEILFYSRSRASRIWSRR